MLSPVIKETIIGNVEVREVFKITKVGAIAGPAVQTLGFWIQKLKEEDIEETKALVDQLGTWWATKLHGDAPDLEVDGVGTRTRLLGRFGRHAHRHRHPARLGVGGVLEDHV